MNAEVATTHTRKYEVPMDRISETCDGNWPTGRLFASVFKIIPATDRLNHVSNGGVAESDESNIDASSRGKQTATQRSEKWDAIMK